MRHWAMGLGVFGMALAADLAQGATVVDLPANGRYEQDFSSLKWENNTSTTATDFGEASSGTVGWVHTTSSGNLSSKYFFSTGNPTSTGWLYSGDPVNPTSPKDLSPALLMGNNEGYIALFLRNPGPETIDSPQVRFTTECWKRPTKTSQKGMFNYTVADFPDGLPTTNIWGALTLKSSTARIGFDANTPVGTQHFDDVPLTGLQWEAGRTLVLQWYYPADFYTAGQVVGLDDVVVVPEPSLLMTLAGVTCAGLSLRQRRAGAPAAY